MKTDLRSGSFDFARKYSDDFFRSNDKRLSAAAVRTSTFSSSNNLSNDGRRSAIWLKPIARATAFLTRGSLSWENASKRFFVSSTGKSAKRSSAASRTESSPSLSQRLIQSQIFG